MASLPSLCRAMVSSRLAGDVAVGDEIRRLRRRHLDGGAQDDAGQAVAPDGGPEQLGILAVGREVADLAVGRQQVHAAHVVAEAARAVMVLAVDVACDRAADGDLPGSRQHRDPQPERQRRLHQLVEVHPGVDVGQPGVGADRVDGVQRGHVDHQAAAVLRVVAVGAAQPARDNAPSAAAGVGHPGHRLGDHLGIGGARAPPPPTARCGPTRSAGWGWWSRQISVLNIVKEGTALAQRRLSGCGRSRLAAR